MKKIKRFNYRRKSKCFNKNNQIKKRFKKAMKNLKLTKKESQVLDDVMNYMIDYMQDEVWTTQDRLAFDRIYSKLHEKFS